MENRVKFKIIPGYRDYFVTEDGRVWSNKAYRFLKHGVSSGYPFVNLHRNGKAKSVKVHRLVAEAFCPNAGRLLDVNHINGDKHDNRSANLEWVSRSGNHKHAWDSGLRVVTPRMIEAGRTVGKLPKTRSSR